MRSSTSSILMIASVTLLFVVAILFLGLTLTDPPRGLLFYSSFGIVGAVAIVGGLLSINARLGRGEGRANASAATMAIISTAAVGYAVSVLAATFIYWMLRGPDGDDLAFSGILFVLTAGWFGIGIVLYSRDLDASTVQVRLDATNTSAAGLATRISRVSAILGTLEHQDPAEQEALVKLRQRLGILEGRWRHTRTGEHASAAELERSGRFCDEAEAIAASASESGAAVGTGIASLHQALVRFESMPVSSR